MRQYLLLIAMMLVAIFTTSGCAPVTPGSGETAMTPSEPRCEYLANPGGVDVASPRLSWEIVGGPRSARQTAYQVLVASSADLLAQDQGDVWDSGKVDSDQSIGVNYAGPALRSGQNVYWKVRVWDQLDQPAPWSKPATWSMGLLSAGDWSAKWIGKDEDETKLTDRRLPARWLRRDFTIDKPVGRAVVYMSGLGLSELQINGQKVGDEVLSPALSDYTKHVFYVAHDVTSQLKPGANALGVILGNGRFFAPRDSVGRNTATYGLPKLLLQMHVEFADGGSQDLISDQTWKLSTAGPIVANNEYDGEEYDARREFEGWSMPGFDDSKWETPQLVAGPAGTLCSPMDDPIRVTGTLQPRTVKEIQPGVFIYDMGQNMVGWCRLKVSGPAGTAVSMRFAESLNPDGSLYVANLRKAKVTDIYTLRGGGVETWSPRFTYHGFRYVEMKGFPGKPGLDAIQGCIVNDDVPSAGDFACSDNTINQVYRNIVWGVRGNYRSMPTDCPQRDERQGWLGDRAAESRGESYIFRNDPLYAKWVRDMSDAQRADGNVSDVCPAFWPLYTDNVTWPSAMVIIPGALCDLYGDTQPIARNYPAMVKWVDYVNTFIKDDLVPIDKYGDWCVPPADPKVIHSTDPAQLTAKPILGTTYFYHCLTLMEQYATMLGRTGDAWRFRLMAAQLKKGLNDKYLNRQTGVYDNGAQTSSVLPLAFDMTPPDVKQRVFDQLIAKIEKDNYHIGTGLVGGQWLNRVLSDNGRADVCYRLATNRTYPSWGYMLDHNATTIWELWNGNTADPAMNSGNHVMLVGDLVTWLYEYVAGIAPDPQIPGFKHILMRPTIAGDMTWAKATHHSPYGQIASEWHRNGKAFDWKIEIPANSTATVWVPAGSEASVRESGLKIADAAGVKVLRSEAGFTVLEVGSGNYEFESALAK
jgi:alpha-L-rhamnosidase